MTESTTNRAAPSFWEANQQAMVTELARVRQALERLVANIHGSEAPEMVPPPVANSEAPSMLTRLCAAFRLSAFERDLLLLCAGMEFDSRFAGLCASAQDDPRRPYPTFSLALAVLPGAHWSALSPSGPLRFWQLLRMEQGDLLTTSPLHIDERILHHLAGVPHLDERLRALVEPRIPVTEISASQKAVADHLAASLSGSFGKEPTPLVQLLGNEPVTNKAVAASACAQAELDLQVMSASVLPQGTAEIDLLARLWEREAILSASVLLIDGDAIDAANPGALAAVCRFADRLQAPVILSAPTRPAGVNRAIHSVDVPKASAVEQRLLWKHILRGKAAGSNGKVDRLVSQFDLNPGAIRAAAAEALPRTGRENLADRLWQACRRQASPRLERLAQRLEPLAGWEDLVLPAPQSQTLQEIAIQVRHRIKVYEDWGFSKRGKRGLGISALFAGPSGTGKTMAAEVLAGDLRLDLYRIDLSQVVNKYIGETEKNLSRVFDEAESGGAILFFDEADALFGKRSEVHDSHDRYANIEISYLLQRMESYLGLAILATNMKSALDAAFLRRIRFVVDFPFPDASQRAEIWRRVFPPGTPTEGLNTAKLARLSVAGGNIRNIALNAAFLAANQSEPVRMSHLLRAARREYNKLEKPLTDAEVGGWA
jgi:ATPase family associated with various cellular activities (AAA)/Winged helix domain, variant